MITNTILNIISKYFPSTAEIDFDNLITTGGIIIAAIVTALSGIQIALLNTTRIHSKKTREQTENAHKESPLPNLRDNIDVNQYILVEMLKGITDTQKEQGEKLNNHGEKLNTLTQVVSGHTEYIDEQTIENPNRKRKI